VNSNLLEPWFPLEFNLQVALNEHESGIKGISHKTNAFPQAGNSGFEALDNSIETSAVCPE